MIAWLVGLSGRAQAWLAGIAAALVAGAWLLLAVHRGGRDAERGAQAQRDMEAVNVRVEEDARAARTADPAAELRRRWGR